jgi:4-hydroxy-4-methyl-2-oxoglutarate aldolase
VIILSGTRLSPGGLIFADSDGVVVVAREDVSDLLQKALQRNEKKSGAVEEIRSGKTTLKIYGFDRKLVQLGLGE